MTRRRCVNQKRTPPFVSVWVFFLGGRVANFFLGCLSSRTENPSQETETPSETESRFLLVWNLFFRFSGLESAPRNTHRGYLRKRVRTPRVCVVLRKRDYRDDGKTMGFTPNVSSRFCVTFFFGHVCSPEWVRLKTHWTGFFLFWRIRFTQIKCLSC